jgi:hypothetical protein
MKIMKNMEKAQHYGSMFGQDVEPTGTYVLEKDFDRKLDKPWVEGQANISNPLVIDVDDDTLISYKYELAKKYKAKGKRLTEKLMEAGYDAIITMRNGDSGEIILFPNCKFMLGGLDETKTFIKKRLFESLTHKLIESYLEEDYPTNFDLKEFSKLTSYNKRIQYCQERLKRISSGSSRIVYMVDDTKVLKIARNKKGLAQNDVEATNSNYHDIKDITARVFAYDDNDLWIEMELARKVTPQIFQQVIGFTFDDYCGAISNYYSNNNPQKARYIRKYNIDKETVDAMWENEFIKDIFSFLGGYEVPVGDLCKLNSYGLVKRNGEDTIVMIDYGITSDVWDEYYG